jgi:hypothetical protein
MYALVIDESSKGFVDRQLKVIAINSEKVKQAIEELRDLLPDDPPPTDGTLRRWRMEEVQLTLEISGEGGVTLIGSATVGVSGGINVTYKRLE